jgi:hypothetical protein
MRKNYHKMEMGGRGTRVDRVSNTEQLDICRKGGLVHSRYDFGRGGTQYIFYFHPQMVVGPYFACALCGALLRTYSVVYKHIKFCKWLEGGTSMEGYQKCAKQTVATSNQKSPPVENTIKKLSKKKGFNEFMEAETEAKNKAAEFINPHGQPQVGLENSTIVGKPDEVLEPLETQAKVQKDKQLVEISNPTLAPVDNTNQKLSKKKGSEEGMEAETETADVIIPNEQPAAGLENSTIRAKSDGVIEPVEKEAEVAKVKPKKKK